MKLLQNISITIVFLLISYLGFCQESSSTDFQRENFEKAELALKNNLGREALMYYEAVRRFEITNELELKSKNKIDSLLPIYQKQEAEKWIGTWYLKNFKSEDFRYEKIKFSRTQLFLYLKKNDKTATRIEKINHTQFSGRGVEFFLPINVLTFANNEKWRFTVEIKSDEIRLFPTNIYDVVMDHRLYLRDPVERQKALAEEIRSYYVLQK
ncbi:hypothetical protein FLAN108750_10900 [Flavobacterium antarcticum]|uniref:hypothetical protein n=1 Tax=Flavobacterium antarcticum TaxID=271155 RepID=UPI0003B50C89|nr:hypothetical protein [Flavobacterium antarcticum]